MEQSLNSFLTEAQKGNFPPEYVDSSHMEKYAFFFYGLNGIGKSENKVFYAPNVLKSYSFDGETYFLTVAFTGTKNDQPFVYKIVEFKVVPESNSYRFYCPFEERTVHFNSTTIGSVTYHHSGTLDVAKAEKFVAFKRELSQNTDTPDAELDYYSFKSLDELLQSYGLLHDATKCNFLSCDLGFGDDGGNMFVTGTNNENYIFEYLGDYLYYNMPDSDDMYWPFVNGMSAYYGGYGLSGDSIETLKKQFRNKLAENPTIDFLAEFRKGRKSSVKRHFSYYVISAFLSQEAIEKHGFDKALELVYSGGKGERFFANLKRLLGIDEANFHETIVRLIQG